jgi:hypothetical protein
MTLRVPSRSRRFRVRFALFLLSLQSLLVVSRASAADSFPGYPEDIRLQAVRVVDAAGPGNGEILEREVRVLRRAMFDRSILSINAIPDRIFERAAREGWAGRSYESLRAVVRVSPLSVPLWAWLAWEDATRVRLESFLSDITGFSGVLHQYGPGLVGATAWVVLLSSAFACWFAVWASINLFFRAAPALTSDVTRIFKGLPRPEIFANLVVIAGLALPVACGVGIAVSAILWIAISTAYLRRGELLIGGMAILLLVGLFLAGGFLESMHSISQSARQGGWLAGEGYSFRGDPEDVPLTVPLPAGAQLERLARTARARAEMQGGSPEKAETLWTGIAEEGGDSREAFNNRGIVRVRLGRIKEALADFEAAMERYPGDVRPYWNAYQLYLQEFRLEQASRVQPAAWAGIRNLSPFDYRAEEMTHGELVASPPRIADVWNSLFATRGEWLLKARHSRFHDLFFRPLPGAWALFFLAAGGVWAATWKTLSMKVWMNSSCRSCGAATLVVGNREATDICNACGSQLGRGIRVGEERERRGLTIELHRRYVRACTILFPGAGIFWAGKEFQALLFGILLSLFAALFTVSSGAARLSGGLTGDMQADISRVSLISVTILWVICAGWGWRSFENLQLKHNVAGGRR